MNNSFENVWKSKIKYKSRVDLYENLYLKAIIESYSEIDKSVGLEEEIRDRFYHHLTHKNPLTKHWYDLEILDICFEKWKMDADKNKSRVDLSFFWSGFGHFEIECKRLFQQPSKNNAYFDEGLIRFIELKYSEKNQYAGMIGFVVSGNIEKIINEISEKAKSFHPLTSSNIVEFKEWKSSFASYHIKKNENVIKIYHLFFRFDISETERGHS